MKNIKRLFIVTFIALVGMAQPVGVFASAPFGIDYIGGEPLGEGNVVINKDLIEGLSPLVATGDGIEVGFSNSNKWKDGYIKSGPTCVPVSYFEVVGSSDVSQDKLNFSISDNQYRTNVEFENIVFERDPEYSGDERAMAVSVSKTAGYVNPGYYIFSDAGCSERLQDIKPLKIADENGMFVQMRLKLYKVSENDVFTSDKLFFGIIDIDAAESFKILNESNKLNSGDMFAASAEDLQPLDPAETLRNMFVDDGNYIYSQYGTVGFNTSKSNVFVKVKTSVQMEGLDLVFGFKGSAGAGISYYAQQYNVSYVSDKNGVIKGIDRESIISGNNPSGSASEANSGYKFEYWTADKDVVLNDGTKIKIGQPLTAEQVRDVVVNEDLVFIAHHGLDNPVAVPDTGAFTSDTNASFTGLSLVGLIFGITVLVGTIVKRNRNKVDLR